MPLFSSPLLPAIKASFLFGLFSFFLFFVVVLFSHALEIQIDGVVTNDVVTGAGKFLPLLGVTHCSSLHLCGPVLSSPFCLCHCYYWLPSTTGPSKSSQVHTGEPTLVSECSCLVNHVLGQDNPPPSHPPGLPFHLTSDDFSAWVWGSLSLSRPFPSFPPPPHTPCGSDDSFGNCDSAFLPVGSLPI